MHTDTVRHASFTIAPFEPALRDRIASLVVGIQREEFGIPISAADQPDLLDVPGHFQCGKGGFWCATSGERVVGTVGLLDAGEGLGVLRKMFVAPDFRGRDLGTAQRLFDTAMEWAASHGFSTVMLGTVDRLRAAIRFYERNGFVEVSPEQLPPHFPRMAVDDRFFRREIARGAPTDR